MTDIPTLQARLDSTRIALDDAIVAQLVREPWRIAEALYGITHWPPVPWETLTDTLAYAEGECRWRLRLHGFRHHPKVHRAELCVDALLRMLAD